MQSQQKASSQAALVELVHQARNQSDELQSLNQESRRIHVKIAHAAVIAASIAALIASVWVYVYLANTVYAYPTLFRIVLGQDFAIGTYEEIQVSLELFVISARFMLAFGVSWLPLTFIVAFLDLVRQLIFKR